MASLVGRVGLVLKGAWDSDAAYDIMDVVTYNNSVYIAKQLVPAGTLPTNTTYWEVALDAALLQTKAAGANKVSSATSGNFAALDANGDLADSGHKHSDYATKVSSATNGNLAGLDTNGNLTDSRIYANKVITKEYYASSASDISIEFSIVPTTVYFVAAFRRSLNPDERNKDGFGVFTVYSDNLIWVSKDKLNGIVSSSYDSNTGKVTFNILSYMTVCIFT